MGTKQLLNILRISYKNQLRGTKASDFDKVEQYINDRLIELRIDGLIKNIDQPLSELNKEARTMVENELNEIQVEPHEGDNLGLSGAVPDTEEPTS